MRVLSIANRKGGVGKTVVSANISSEMARMGYLVLMVDLDSQCDLSKVYLPRDYSGPGIMEVLQGSCAVEEACVEVRTNLYLIPGSKDLNHFAVRDSERILRQSLLSKMLGEVDFTVIDTPPGISEATINGFVASDSVLVVTEPEQFSVENLADLLADLRHIQRTMNPRLRIEGIVANKVNLCRSLTKVMLTEMKRAFGRALLPAFISYDTSIPTSLRGNIPVRELHWRSRTVDQFRQLTEEVLERMVRRNGNGQASGKQKAT